MTDIPEDIRCDVVAYRIQGKSGWNLATAWSGVDVAADLKLRGVTTAEVRTISWSWFVPEAAGTGVAGLDDFSRDDPVEYGWAWDDTTGTWVAPEEPIPSLSGKPTATEEFQINFGKVDVGWQPIFLCAAGQSTDLYATTLFDPFPEILQWLEVIAREECGRVVINQEGNYRELLAFPLSDRNQVRIVVSRVSGWLAPFREIKLDIDISRRAFVGAFYEALRTHADSEKYDPYQWAAIPLKDYLARDGISESPEQLANLDAASLRDVVYGYIVPDDFDGWDATQRIAFVNGLLEENESHWLAEDLRNLRSTEIEAFLGIR